MRRDPATRGYIVRDDLPEDVLAPPVSGARRLGILRCVLVAGRGDRKPGARRGERPVKRFVGWARGRSRSEPNVTPEPDVTADPTPIRISKRTRTVLILAVLVLLGLVIWQVPSVLTTVVGGFALALALSFPVRLFSRLMPRGLAILLSFLLLVGIVVLAALILVPLLLEQFAAFGREVPGIANTVEKYLSDALDTLQDRGLLPSDSQQLVSRVREDLTNAARAIAGNVLGGALGFITSTVSFAVTLFGAIFIAAYLLVDVRRFKAAFLSAAPHDYRRDAKTLWEAFGYSLSRYLGGLALVLLIQGTISAVGLFLLGVPYALVLGAFVSVAAVIPYLGAWLSAIPAVIVALTVSPTTAFMTALLFLGIQQLEGNFLTPKIQGDTLRVHPVLVLLAVIVGGGLGGIFGVIVAVPTLAVLRVLSDFFRVRLTTED
jgi:predicted PurR-regulated permease PerM